VCAIGRYNFNVKVPGCLSGSRAESQCNFFLTSFGSGGLNLFGLGWVGGLVAGPDSKMPPQSAKKTKEKKRKEKKRKEKKRKEKKRKEEKKENSLLSLGGNLKMS
jgi:hypothetical protein